MRLVLVALTAALAAMAQAPFEKQGLVGTTRVTLPGLSASAAAAILVSIDKPDALGDAVVDVSIPGVAQKLLHAGDPDLFLTAAGAKEVRMQLRGATRSPARYHIVVRPAAGAKEFEPNNSPAEANPIRLGELVPGTADDVPYVPAPGARATPSEAGVDWFRFDFDGAPKLVFFQLELIERDNIPMDVSIWRLVNGKPVEYHEGEDPVTIPHEVQAQPGNKFTTRVLRDKGTYYVRVQANHPEYALRTRVYDPPPYRDPRMAVRVALDFLLGAGDSWHANTPRRGGVWDRIASVHQETSLCVACHPTHFTQRAALYAKRNGYPVHQRDQLQFLSERFYNNPRPLFGFEGQATWARVISASANVLSRMSHLMDIYEKEVSKESRPAFHDGIRGFLKLYYQGRTKLPPDETNGNQPLVSAYEVAWYSWEVSRDPVIERLIEQDAGVKNLIDLCYQTQALAAIDREKYAAKIDANAKRLLTLQRPSGQWSMKFDENEKEVEFQTGHVLWTLANAGVSRDNPQVQKAMAYLLSRQQEFGGWLDPLQSFENFRTPFRETQMAVLALSSYYRGDGGEDSPLAAPIATPAARLGDASKITQRRAAYDLRAELRRGASPDLLLRALASADSRTRWGATRVFATHFSHLATEPRYADALIARLSDASPMVRVQAIKGLWQFWFWSASNDVRGRIEDALLSQLRAATHPWVEQNLREAIYNVADENIRYLYNNWVPSIAREEDRERVVRGRLEIEARQAAKFATFLEKEPPAAQKRLLRALVEFPLRRADIYDPKADHSSVVDPPPYNRIGNDIEQITFFGESAERLASALAPLLDAADPELRRLARGAALIVKEGSFGAPVKLAGRAGPAREKVLAVLPKPAPRVTAAAAPGAKPARRYERPDESYFRGYVQPILEARGKDGQACVNCHISHAIFDGTYAKALNVADLDDPENSLILRKPTTDAEIEGTLEAQSGGKRLSHGGGIRWEKGSPEYNTILNWIRGAKP